jgi:DNA polymerase-3 subunit gamma/tau
MAYTVLARKYRSQTFTEVIGQEPIATTLVNAIRVGRIHHGYLFTGTRGVGKTSMARILAKALNCLKADGPTPTPCGECDACRAIAEGQDVDVLEIDAASNTGVDNIRELRSNTAYRPARSRFKVYIIDEVHMLSTGAFNALLKTLEEPPEHVKFILATTELQKVPATIQSRCQRFIFRNIGPDAIAKRLKEIVAAEGATADDPVIQRVARLANGSMRDALSILDQLMSVSPKHLDAKVLDELLPPAQDERIFALLQHTADGDVAAVLTDLDGIVSEGRGLEIFCADAIEIVRTLMLVRTCGPDASLVDIPAGVKDAYVALAQRFELSHYVQMIAALEELRRNVRYSGAGRALTEVLLARFARLRDWSSIEQLLAQVPAGGGDSEKKKTVADEPASAAPVAAPVGPTIPAAPATAAPVARTMSARSAVPLPANGHGPGSTASPAPRAVVAVAAAHAALPQRETAVVAPAPALHEYERPLEDGPPPAEPDFDVEATGVVTDTGDDYHGESAAAAQTAVPMWRPATAEEQARARQDPLVKQVLELFEGSVIEVKARMQPAGEETE